MRAAGLPDRQQATVDRQLVIDVARFERLSASHRRDVGQRDPGERREDLGSGAFTWTAVSFNCSSSSSGLGFALRACAFVSSGSPP